MNKRLAIIPARGGSKRIKNKNIRDFAGKPMIHHIIDTAIKSNLFDKIHVSTESIKIKECVEKANINVDFMRPIDLADDHTPLMPVIKFVVNQYKNKNLNYQEIWLLMACSPLIEPEDLRNAGENYSKQINDLKPLMAVTEYPAPIEWAFLINNQGELVPRFEEKFFKERSQDLPASYFDSGSFVIFPKKFIEETNYEGSDQGFISYKLSKTKAIDIDNEDDWRLAEAIFKARDII